VELTNLAVTGSKRAKAPLSIQSLGMSQEGREKFRVTGAIPIRNTWGSVYRFSARDPGAFFARSFKSFLQEAGIEVVHQKTGTGDLPSHARKLAVYESPPLKDLIYGLNRHSNNFMAETLLRSLGARVLGNPGTAAKGLSVVHRTLHDLGIPEREVALDNGSGLSRKSLASPRAFCRLLRMAHQDGAVGPALVDSLAVSGQEGTLRKRMCSSPFVIQGKTGTLSNVMGFAGYVSIPGGESYAVAIILNEVKDFGNARQALDSFLETLPMVCNPS
jgi:D-alanyl-D-alanine carboxypeptidase/D-alanyl-D-alanine-endopeptidase (penicillin-binding protein 4)